MLTQSMKERDRVITELKEDLEADLSVKSPIWRALKDIANDIVNNKKKIAMACHCSPVL